MSIHVLIRRFSAASVLLAMAAAISTASLAQETAPKAAAPNAAAPKAAAPKAASPAPKAGAPAPKAADPAAQPAAPDPERPRLSRTMASIEPLKEAIDQIETSLRSSRYRRLDPGSASWPAGAGP
jgi:hypothetical protein